jgi:nucleoredoxin
MPLNAAWSEQANWCPDCREFQPKLNDFYAEVNASKQQLDVVFLSSDVSEEDQQTHFATKHGAWWMVPRDAEIRNELRRKVSLGAPPGRVSAADRWCRRLTQYGIRNGKDDAEVGVTHRNSGIPALVLIRPDGEVVDFQGASQVENDGAKALAAWQTKTQAK